MPTSRGILSEHVCKQLVKQYYRRLRNEAQGVVLRELINTLYSQGYWKGVNDANNR